MRSIVTQTPKKIDVNLHKGIKVFAPATLGNVAGVEGVFGIALENWGVEVVAKFKESAGVTISSVKGFPSDIFSSDALSEIIRLADLVLGSVNRDNVGVELQIRSNIPESKGLGVEASVSVGVVMAINEILGRPYEKRQLLSIALKGMANIPGGHVANRLAAGLLGGCMLFRGGADYDVVRVASPRGLYLLVIYIEDLSELSEGSLPAEYNNGDIANISAFVLGMTNADFALIKRTLSNVSSFKYFNRALHRQLFMGTEVSGALGCTIDGVGSLYYAFYDNSLAADKTAAYFDEMLTSRDLKSNILVSRINNEGAVLV